MARSLLAREEVLKLKLRQIESESRKCELTTVATDQEKVTEFNAIDALARKICDTQLAIQSLQFEINAKREKRRAIKGTVKIKSGKSVPADTKENLQEKEIFVTSADGIRHSTRIRVRASRLRDPQPECSGSHIPIDKPGYTWTSYLNGSIFGGIPKLVLRRVPLDEEFEPPVPPLPSTDVKELEWRKEINERKAAKKAARRAIIHAVREEQGLPQIKK